MMIKKPKILYSDYYVYCFLFLLAGMSIIVPFVFAETIIYSDSYPVWYNYDCTDASPTSFTQLRPTSTFANVWKYFSFYDGSCYVTLHTFNLVDLANLENTTSVNYYVDTRSLVLNDPTETETTSVNCQLYYFENIDTTADISKTPILVSSAFDCTGTQGAIIESTIPFSVTNNATLTAHVQDGNYTQSFMLFPTFTADMRSDLDGNGTTYAIGKFDNSLGIVGDGFNCVTIEASNWCNMYNDPWGAIKKALGEDYIGDWFYVFVFFPIPFMVFLVSRNGTYAGFVCLPILLFINTIDRVVFDISLALMALAGAFGFYEMLRKRLVE